MSRGLRYVPQKVWDPAARKMKDRPVAVVTRKRKGTGSKRKVVWVKLTESAA
jgi:hypothetical protein